MKRIWVAGLVASALLGSVSTAFGITVTVDAKSVPDTITAAPDGALILSSSTKPVIYRAAKGETQARIFIDASSEGNVFFYGVMADGAANTLWACQLSRIPGTTNDRKSTLRSFDLKSGAPKTSWVMPGATNLCNDIAVGPDHAAYVTDSVNSRIYRLRPGATEGELVSENPRLFNGVNGITFLDGQLYVNNAGADNIYRIPLDASGKAGDPVHVWTDQPIKGPDGMRAENGRLFLVESRGGRADMLIVSGDIAHVTVLLTGLTQPTSVQPAGDVVWVNDRPNDKAMSIPMPK